jgi:hypothetical protein
MAVLHDNNLRFDRVCASDGFSTGDFDSAFLLWGVFQAAYHLQTSKYFRKKNF